MQRVLTAAVLALLVAFGACTVRRWLVSDETEIRWLITDAAAAFNAGRPGSAVAPLADDWWDRTSGIHKDTLHEILVALVFQDRGADGSLLWAVDVPEDRLAIEVDGDNARATFDASFTRKRGDKLEPIWSIAVDAELRDGRGGWEIIGTSHRTLSGVRR